MTDQHRAETVETHASRSRALVVVDSDGPSRGTERPEAVFLAQLIACDRRLPAYRQARKASPDAATSAYSRPSGPAPARLDCLV